MIKQKWNITDFVSRTFAIGLILQFGIYASLYADDIQKFSVKNNDTVLAIISERELSRFVFEQDKIKHIYAISGEIHYELADENLYIRPNVQKPINFFVNTEKGRTYKIIATPKDIPATQISISSQNGILRPISTRSNTRTHVSKTKTISASEKDLRSKIARVIKAILSNDRTVDYKVEDSESSHNYSSTKDIEMLLQSTWSNQDLYAYKYTIINISDNTIKVDKSRYLEPGIQAVYVEKEHLKPNEITTLITVGKIR